MTKKEIKMLNGELVTRRQFEEIEEHEEVASVENNGSSGSIPGATWYTVSFIDGDEIDVYFKPE